MLFAAQVSRCSQDSNPVGKKFSAALHIMSKAARSFSRRNHRAGAFRDSIRSQIIATDGRARKVSSRACSREPETSRKSRRWPLPSRSRTRGERGADRRERAPRFSASFSERALRPRSIEPRPRRGGESPGVDCRERPAAGARRTRSDVTCGISEAGQPSRGRCRTGRAKRSSRRLGEFS